MFILVGPSCSGKDTLGKLIELDDRFEKYERVRMYTSRPMREKEVEGDPYFFRDKAFFQENKDRFVTLTSYYSFLDPEPVWYGTMIEQYKENSFVVGLSPFETILLQRYFKEHNIPIDPIVVYITASRNTLMMRSLRRGSGLDESYRRILSDYGRYNGFERLADSVIHNEDRDIRSVVTEIYDAIKIIRIDRKERGNRVEEEKS